MKKMMCNTLTILAALAFLMVLGAAIEGTMALPGALVLLAALAAGIRAVYLEGEKPAARRPRRPAAARPAGKKLPVPSKASSETQPLRAA